MMNRTHAVSAIPAALATAPLIGLHGLIPAIPLVVVMAGWATAPDLDCAGSHPTHVCGPAGRWLSEAIRSYSAWLYRHSQGPRDKHHAAGTHRYATHTPIHSVLAAVLAIVTTAPGGVFGAVATLVWLLLGVAWAALSMGRSALVAAVVAFGVWFLGPILTGGLHAWQDVLAVFVAHSAWLGLAVGGGCLVHLVGDAFTDEGIPAFFPLKILGARWRRYGLLPRVLRFTAGKGVENYLVLPALLIGSVLLLPGVWPIVLDLTRHATTHA